MTHHNMRHDEIKYCTVQGANPLLWIVSAHLVRVVWSASAIEASSGEYISPPHEGLVQMRKSHGHAQYFCGVCNSRLWTMKDHWFLVSISISSSNRICSGYKEVMRPTFAGWCHSRL